MNHVQKRQLVLVEWIDSHSGRGWRDLDTIAEDTKPLSCRSVGWIAKRTKEMTMLVASLSGEGQGIVICGTCDIAIPNAAIVKITRLRH